MYTKNQVLDYLETLIENSTEEQKRFFYDQVFVDGITGEETVKRGVMSVLNEYFTEDINKLSKACREMAEDLYCDILRRNIFWEKEEGIDYAFPTNFPYGYNDIGSIFFDFGQIVETKPIDFNMAWHYGVGIDGITEVLDGNTYLDTWTAELDGRRPRELAFVKDISEFCKENGIGNSLIVSFMEERGNLITKAGYVEIATEIYINRKLKSVIKQLGLSTYIPTYLDGKETDTSYQKFPNYKELADYILSNSKDLSAGQRFVATDFDIPFVWDGTNLAVSFGEYIKKSDLEDITENIDSARQEIQEAVDEAKGQLGLKGLKRVQFSANDWIANNGVFELHTNASDVIDVYELINDVYTRRLEEVRRDGNDCDVIYSTKSYHGCYTTPIGLQMFVPVYRDIAENEIPKTYATKTELAENYATKEYAQQIAEQSGKVKTVNNQEPDENGNITVEAGGHEIVEVLPSDEEAKENKVYFIESADDLYSVEKMGDNEIPVGTIFPFAGNNELPAGYLLCNGSFVNKNTYPALFKAIGYTYGGEGDYFALPNLTDKFIEGSTQAGTEKEAGLPNIDGSFSVRPIQYNALLSSSGAFFNITKGTGRDNPTCTQSGVMQEEFISFDASRSSSVYGNSNTVQPPALTMRYIIKAFDGAIVSESLVNVTSLANNKLDLTGGTMTGGLKSNTGDNGDTDNSVAFLFPYNWDDYSTDFSPTTANHQTDKSVILYDKDVEKSAELTFRGRNFNADGTSNKSRSTLLSVRNPWLNNWGEIALVAKETETYASVNTTLRGKMTGGSWISALKNPAFFVAKSTASVGSQAVDTFCMEVESGRISLATLSGTNSLYFSYGTNANMSANNNSTTQMYWDAPNSNLVSTKFTGTVSSTSDERLKENIVQVDDALLNAWEKVEFYEFNFLSDEDKQKHCGLIVQRIQKVFNEYGLSTSSLVSKITNENEEYFVLNYTECLCIEACMQRRKVKLLEERLSRIEEVLNL